MVTMKGQMTVQEAGRLGGASRRGACKARSKQMRAYWKKVKAGKLPQPERYKGVPIAQRKPKQQELPLETEKE